MNMDCPPVITSREEVTLRWLEPEKESAWAQLTSRKSGLSLLKLATSCQKSRQKSLEKKKKGCRRLKKNRQKN